MVVLVGFAVFKKYIWVSWMWHTGLQEQLDVAACLKCMTKCLPASSSLIIIHAISVSAALFMTNLFSINVPWKTNVIFSARFLVSSFKFFWQTSKKALATQHPLPFEVQVLCLWYAVRTVKQLLAMKYLSSRFPAKKLKNAQKNITHSEMRDEIKRS